MKAKLAGRQSVLLQRLEADLDLNAEKFADKIGIPTNLVLAEYILELKTAVDKLKERLDQAEER